MKTNVHFLMSSIIENNLSVHKVSSDLYKRLKIYFKDYFKEHKNKKKSNLFFSLIGNFKLPYFKMGKINSSHLLGLDELIIFSFYKKLKILGYQKVADLGANIGLHSVILGKLNYQVRAYEPDPDHVKQFKKNIKINKLKKIKLIEKAVDIKEGSVIFNKILNNTTASFIGNAKLKTSGVVKKFIVRTENIKNILKWAQIIKMDIEGSEYDALLGGIKIIHDIRPGLAISVYHKPSDLWELPLLIDSWNLGYDLYLRSHQYNGFYVVLYAIPK